MKGLDPPSGSTEVLSPPVSETDHKEIDEAVLSVSEKSSKKKKKKNVEDGEAAEKKNHIMSTVALPLLSQEYAGELI